MARYKLVIGRLEGKFQGPPIGGKVIRLPRMTIRRWIIVVILVATALTLWTMEQRSRGLRRRAAFHAAESEQLTFYYEVETQCLADLERELEVDLSLTRKHRGSSQALRYLESAERNIGKTEESRAILRAVAEQIEHHAHLRRKYEQASSRPWVSVSPDPPEPAWPSQGDVPTVFGPTMAPVIRVSTRERAVMSRSDTTLPTADASRRGRLRRHSTTAANLAREENPAMMISKLTTLGVVGGLLAGLMLGTALSRGLLG